MAQSVIGAPFQELLQLVIHATQKTAYFKSHLNRLKNTLLTIQPIFKETKLLNEVIDRPPEETAAFVGRLKAGMNLVYECSEVACWNVYKKFVYATKLGNLDSEIVRFFKVYVEAQVGVDSSSRRRRNNLVGVKGLEEKLDRIILGGSSRFLRRRSSSSSDVPEVPGLVVGLESQLAELKGMLLRDDASVVVVSGPGGCGKTTLAKMLCHDDKIRDLFRDHIFYVTVSKQASLEVVAQNILNNHYPGQLREFHTDREAKNEVEKLMKLQSDDILVVLDDVWSGSESLVENLKFQIPGYRILVTSRFVFPRFDSTFKLKLLNEKDARKLFCYSAFPKDGIPNVAENLVNEMVKGCRGFPLALKVIGASLCEQPESKWRSTLKKWSEAQSIFDFSSDLLLSLKSSVDELENSPVMRECYLDLGSFPEDQKIEATLLMDLWVELLNLDEEGMYTLENLFELSTRNLLDLVPTRKTASEVEGYCKEYYVTQHDLLRDLAIHLSSQEPIEQRRRMIVDITGNDIPAWWIGQIHHPIRARLLSISTDEGFSSSWPDMQVPKLEALILNFRTRNYSLPHFMERMTQLKVLIITNYGYGLSVINNFATVGHLSNLRRIRLQRVSIDAAIFGLRNLRKLSLIMCELGEAFESFASENPPKLPDLVEIEIDGCDDLRKFPTGLCTLSSLKKLSITNCHELVSLPEEFGGLRNLEVLTLHSCTKLEELPETIGCLHNLRFLDISDCLSLNRLPVQMGELCGLTTIHMSGCRGLYELPASVNDLLQLKAVICDEETSYLWKYVETDATNLRIHVVEQDIFANFMKFFNTSKVS